MKMAVYNALMMSQITGQTGIWYKFLLHWRSQQRATLQPYLGTRALEELS